jgi:hypothetical protein
MQLSPIGRLEHLTFKGNLRQGRHAWLRFTPAYSVHLVTALVRAQCAKTKRRMTRLPPLEDDTYGALALLSR